MNPLKRKLYLIVGISLFLYSVAGLFCLSGHQTICEPLWLPI